MKFNGKSCCLLLVCSIAYADPLRVLRAVRFATRFGFTPDPAILTAAASDEVNEEAGIYLYNLVISGSYTFQ